MLFAVLLACATGSAPGPADAPAAPPTCAGAYDAIVASLRALHAGADKPMPQAPDRAAWIATCDGLALSADALRCLQPRVATADPAGCAPLLAGVDRAPLDQPFLDAMVPAQGATP